MSVKGCQCGHGCRLGRVSISRIETTDCLDTTGNGDASSAEDHCYGIRHRDLSPLLASAETPTRRASEGGVPIAASESRHPSLAPFECCAFWILPRRGRKKYQPRATPGTTKQSPSTSLKGRNRFGPLGFLPQLACEYCREISPRNERPVWPFQGMGYSRVPAPRALPWADLWLPLRGGRKVRNIKTGASG